MADERFPHLSSEGRIGSMTLRNRMVVTAMGVGLGEEDGTWGERICAYHEEQARGGAALIISGSAGIAWPVGGAHRNQVAISDDRYIPGVAAVARAVQRHGAKFAIQLHLAGPGSFMDLEAGRPLWVPSLPLGGRRVQMDYLFPDEEKGALVAPTPPATFKVLTAEDLKLVVELHMAAAGRALAAGVDGLELIAGNGYLLTSFLSPYSNRRTDDYGGPLENRARLLLEVVRGVRAVVGREFPLWCKLDWREVGLDPGITTEDAVAVARMLETEGVDAISVSAHHDKSQWRLTYSSFMPQEPGVNLPGAAAIKAAVGLPVICVGRIEPEVAEAAIAAGELDFLSMGRKILADPHLPRKIVEGRREDVRPCVYSYTCYSSILLGRPVRCSVNPLTGLESVTAPIKPVRPLRVVVVGGGPAGMETACRLDLDGHQVTLFERDERLGGTLRFAAMAYEANARLLDWLRGQVEASRVDVRLGVQLTPEALQELRPDHVVVATGGACGRVPILGADLPHVFGGDDLGALILDRGALGQRIVIIGGDLVGLELAEFLRERDRTVTVVDEAEKFGVGLSYSRRMMIQQQLQAQGVDLQRGASVIRIEADAVTFTDSAGEPRRVAADHVILAKGATGDLTLAETLRGLGFAVSTAGDCNGIGYIEGAIRDAAKVARALSAREAVVV